METDPDASAGDGRRATRRTLARQMQAEFLNNVFSGVFELGPFLVYKSLGYGEFAVAVLSALPTAANLGASAIGAAMEGRPKWPFFVAAAVVGRLPLVALLLSVDAAVFIPVCACVALAQPLFLPAQNRLMQTAYPDAARGRLFGWVAVVGRLGFIPAAYAGAILLRDRPEAVGWLFPAVGALGAAAFLLYAAIPMSTERRPRDPPRRAGTGAPRRWWARVVAATFGDFREVFRDHPAFYRYERAFFIYGVAFLMLQPVDVYFLAGRMRMEIDEFTVARFIVVPLAILATTPLAGRLLDRLGAVRTAGVAFACLVGYPATLLGAVTTGRPEWVYAGFVWFGLSMGIVMSVWNLGAMQFARRRDASIFMGVHVTCVGFRGTLGALVGYAMSQWIAVEAAYLLALALFAVASRLMWKLHREMAAGLHAPRADLAPLEEFS